VSAGNWRKKHEHCLSDRCARELSLNLSNETYTVQGLGNVGSWAARLITPAGSTLVAAEDHTGALSNPSGIDPDKLPEHVSETGGIAESPAAAAIDHDGFLRAQADLSIPVALENQLTVETAPLLDVQERMTAGGANG